MSAAPSHGAVLTSPLSILFLPTNQFILCALMYVFEGQSGGAWATVTSPWLLHSEQSPRPRFFLKNLSLQTATSATARHVVGGGGRGNEVQAGRGRSGSCYVEQASLRFAAILLPLPAKFWDFGCEPPHPTSTGLCEKKPYVFNLGGQRHKMVEGRALEKYEVDRPRRLGTFLPPRL